MAEDKLGRRLGSLPPQVDGRVNGYLSMTIDKVAWREKPHSSVYVYVTWWGEKNPILFIPQDLPGISEVLVCVETTYVYKIMTNIDLFVSYLQDCEELNFEVCANNSVHLGVATLKYLISVLLYNPFRTSCVVKNKDGVEIADIRVSFIFQHNSLANNNDLKIERTLQRVLQKVQSADAKSPLKLRERTVSNGTDILSGIPLFEMIELEDSNRKEIKRNTSLSKLNNDFVTNSTISKLLQQSQSVREDFEKHKFHFIDKSVDGSSDSQIVRDYLLGKSLTEDEEYCALELLKFKTPIEELLHMREDHEIEYCSKHSDGKGKGVLKEKTKKNEGVEQTAELFQSMSRSFENSKKYLKESQNKERKNESAFHRTNELYFTPEERKNIMHTSKFLRLTFQTLSLNFIGLQCVEKYCQAHATNSHPQYRATSQHLPQSAVYFVEYELPQSLRVCSNDPKTRKPWNSYLYRVCSRPKRGKCILFYRQMIHKLAFYKPRFIEYLCASSVTFKIYSRHMNQRLPCFLGHASVSLGNIVKSYIFSSFQEIPILPRFNSNPCRVLSLGTLKLKIEFGSNRACFESKNLTSVLPQSLLSSTEYEYETLSNMVSKDSKNNKAGKTDTKKNIESNDLSNKKSSSIPSSTRREDLEFLTMPTSVIRLSNENILLFGLLHVSRGREFTISDTYLVSHGFWKEDVMTSELHGQTENPVFKFHKIMPVLLSLKLLDRCCNNLMVIEVWSRSSLIGISKLPLNQFYIAFRDPPVVEQLLNSKYPIISVDGWIDVVDPVSQSKVGQLNAILALGTENQIQMLEMTRCLKEEVTAELCTQKQLPTEQGCSVLGSFSSYNKSSNEDVLNSSSLKSHQNKMGVYFSDFHCPNNTVLSEKPSCSFPKRSSLISCSSPGPSHQDSNCPQEIDFDEETVECSPQNSDTFLYECSSFVELPITNESWQEKSSVVRGSDYLDDVLSLYSTNVFEKTTKNIKDDQSHKEVLESNTNTNFLSSNANSKNVSMETTNRSSLISSCYKENVEAYENDPYNGNCPFLRRDQVGTVGEEKDDITVTQNHQLLLDDSYSCREKDNSSSSNKDHGTPILKVSKEGGCLEDNGGEDCINDACDLITEDFDDTSFTVINSDNEKRNCAVLESKDCSNITLLTENVSTQTDLLNSEHFFALVEVINALYIPELVNGRPPNCFVTFHTVNNSLVSTPIIKESTSPAWNWSCEVWLPIFLLESNARSFIFKVWHKNIGNDNIDALDDFVIGFAAVDLRTLLCGLPSISGWFNITDLSGNCKGQIQVSITPLEDIKQITKISETNTQINKRINKGESFMVSIPAESEHFAEERNEDSLKGGIAAEIDTVSDGRQKINIHDHQCKDWKNNVYKKVGSSFTIPSHSKLLLNTIIPKASAIPLSTEGNFDMDPGEELNSELQCNNLSLASLNVLEPEEICSTKLLHQRKDELSSPLSEILQQKFQELDKIITKMKRRCKYLNHSEIERKPLENICVDTSSNLAQEMNMEDTPKFSCIQNCSLICTCPEYSSVKWAKGVSQHQEKEQSDQFNYPHTSSFSNPSLNSETHLEVAREKNEPDGTKNDMRTTDVSGNITLSELMTDHLMFEALKEMDLENIFNPLLFQHIIANHKSQNCSSKFLQNIAGRPLSESMISQRTIKCSKNCETLMWKTQNLIRILSNVTDENVISEYNKTGLSETNKQDMHFLRHDSLPTLSADGDVRSYCNTRLPQNNSAFSDSLENELSAMKLNCNESC